MRIFRPRYASRPSARDRKHEQKKMRDGKSIKLGTQQSGKMSDRQGGNEQ